MIQSPRSIRILTVSALVNSVFGDTEEAYAQLMLSSAERFDAVRRRQPGLQFFERRRRRLAATNGTCYGVDDNSTKLVFFSPIFAGFQLAASFTPDNTEDTRNTLAGAGTRWKDDPGQNSENLSFAASFIQDMDRIRLVLGGGANVSLTRKTIQTTRRMRVATDALRRHVPWIRHRRRFRVAPDFAEDGEDQWVYGAGATYAWSGWAVGLG